MDQSNVTFEHSGWVSSNWYLPFRNAISLPSEETQKFNLKALPEATGIKYILSFHRPACSSSTIAVIILNSLLKVKTCFLQLFGALLSGVLLPSFPIHVLPLFHNFSKLVRTRPDNLGLTVGSLLGGLGVDRNCVR